MEMSRKLHAVAALPQGKILGNRWIGGWAGPRASLEVLKKGEIYGPCRDLNTRILEPVDFNSTNWDTPFLTPCLCLCSFKHTVTSDHFKPLHNTRVYPPYVTMGPAIVKRIAFFLTSVMCYIVSWWQVFARIVSHVLIMHWTYRARPMFQAVWWLPHWCPEHTLSCESTNASASCRIESCQCWSNSGVTPHFRNCGNYRKIAILCAAGFLHHHHH